MNIWTSENLAKYALSSNEGHGEWVLRNGENAIKLKANQYHNGSYIHVLADEFLPNTQYNISLYMDTDDLYSSNKNVPGGIIVYYTDGTTHNVLKTGDKDNPIGWQEVYYITDKSKSVNYIAVYYWTSIAVYYRWDSHITEVTHPSLNKQGIFIVENLHSNYTSNEVASIQEGGDIHSLTFYEF